jgi:hypothetical protein
VDSKLKLVKRNKEGHFILIKGTIYQEEMTFINLYTSKVSGHNFIKHTLKDLKSHVDPNPVVVGDFNTPYYQYIGHPDKKSTKKSKN